MDEEGLMNTLLQDIRYGFRILKKNPGFTLVAILALALGIGANTALFSVVYGVLLKPLPYAQGKELVVLKQEFTSAGPNNVLFSVKELKDYREQNQSLSQAEEYHQMFFLLLDKEPDRVKTGVVSAHFFDLLGVKPKLGRLFADADDKPGAEPVVVLSYDYWMNKEGGDRNIIGHHFKMNDRVHTVIGVLPPIPQYPRENDMYMTTVSCPFRSSQRFIETRNIRLMQLFGRLKPGATLQSGNSDLALIASRLRQTYPQDYPAMSGYQTTMDGLQDQLTRGVRPLLLVLLGTAGLVLLIACANVANLALARMVRREQELAVRAALGADRARLVRQLLTESTMLGLAGGIVGLVIASSCLNLLVTFAARFTTRAAEVGINGTVLLFTLGISVLTGLVFGSIPALSPRANLAGALKEGSNASTVKSSRHSLRNLLVVGQVAVSFMLLIGAGLMIRSFAKLQQVDAGYNSDHVLTVTVPLNFTKYPTLPDSKRFFDQLMERLQDQPGVKSVALMAGAPLSPGTPGTGPFDIQGRTLSNDEVKPNADTNIASPQTFQVLDVPLLRGRFFNDQDLPAAPAVAIVNRSLAQHYFPNEDPIDKRISQDNGTTWLTIVGVVGDVRQYGLEQDALDTIYLPFGQAPFGRTVMLRTSGNPLDYVKQVRAAVSSIDPEQPIADVKTLDQLRGDSLAATRLTAVLLALFATLALAIAATGLSGVIAFLVSQRTREIGIRLALGAQRADVLRMVLADALKLVGLGLAAGIVGALAGSRVMHAILFNTPPNDPATFVVVALVFLVVALLASYIPAQRAAQVDPLVALRTE